MGAVISRALSKSRYRLLLEASEQAKLEELANGIKAEYPAADLEWVVCPAEASWEADIIILAVPYKAEKEIAARIREVVNQKIVISISNPLNQTYSELITAPDSGAAEELQKLLPHSRVIKAFNTHFAANFLKPVIDGKQVDSFIAGNDEESLQTVSGLVASAGYNPIVAGDLSVSRALEKMKLLLIQPG